MKKPRPLSRSAQLAAQAMPAYVPTSVRRPRDDDPQSAPHDLLRVLGCRRCNAPTGIPGARYCDACRPLRLTDELLSTADRARIAELYPEGEPPLPSRVSAANALASSCSPRVERDAAWEIGSRRRNNEPRRFLP